MKFRWMWIALSLAAAGCGGERVGDDGGGDSTDVAQADAVALGSRQCRIVTSGMQLPGGVPESSGAAFQPGSGAVFWTHNDSGGDPVLYAVGAMGRLLGETTVAGAENRDWEDLAVGPCPGGTCAYVADIGDNRGKGGADEIAVFRLPLPRPGAAETARAEEFRARFPGGGRDAEALFVLPDGGIYLINKGNRDAVDLWRWPTPLQAGPVDLVRVRALAPQPDQPGDRVTGAGASPDGRWVAVRSYGQLAIYRTADLLGSGAPAFTVDLSPLGEAQGEGVAMAAGGVVLLTTEGGERMMPGRATFLRCQLPEG